MNGEMSFSERVWNQLPWSQDEEPDEDDPVRDPDEQELEKIAQVTLMVGPDYARDLGQPQEGTCSSPRKQSTDSKMGGGKTWTWTRRG